jgi:hypothetical protein
MAATARLALPIRRSCNATEAIHRGVPTAADRHVPLRRADPPEALTGAAGLLEGEAYREAPHPQRVSNWQVALPVRVVTQ